ncbi:MAG: hypothetical protein AAGF56_09875, partial [Pseudomonadota bacterium]
AFTTARCRGYNIVIGGGSDCDQGLARPLVGPVAAADIHGIIEHVVGSYLKQRVPGQTFLQFARQLDDAGLADLLPKDLQHAA